MRIFSGKPKRQTPNFEKQACGLKAVRTRCGRKIRKSLCYVRLHWQLQMGLVTRYSDK